MKVFVRWVFSLGAAAITFTTRRKGRWKLQISNEQRVSAEIRPLTAGGNPAPIDGVVSWIVEPVGIVSLAVDAEDSKKAVITALPLIAPATAQITASFDADLGAGVRSLTAIGSVTVVPAEAETVEMAFGTPEPA